MYNIHASRHISRVWSSESSVMDLSKPQVYKCAGDLVQVSPLVRTWVLAPKIHNPQTTMQGISAGAHVIRST